MIPSFKKVHFEDRTLGTFQTNVEQVLTPIIGSVIIDGNLLKDIALTAGKNNQIAHKLARLPLFWILARQNTNSVVWESQVATDTYITLNCSSSCTISLWVG